MNVNEGKFRMEDVTAAVLAGGKGKRLGGVHKAFLEVDGKPILDNTLSVLEPIFPRILLSANEAEPFVEFGLEVVGDRIPDKGAPGGLHASLMAAKTDWVFLVACDMPYLADPLIEHMYQHCGPDLDVVVCEWDGRPEPLHAFYRTEIAGPLEAMLSSGNPSFRDLYAEIRVQHLKDVGAISNQGRAFRSINTPEELAAVGGKLP